ncbi:MAG TPA: ornithine carbamoyltransferase [Actinomycetota bacterium]|nr:ornithine carbamoyltransferase [Actinomycetota bacterium]
MSRDFLSMVDLTPAELEHLLDLAAKTKSDPANYSARLAGRAVATIFEEPSTRTRVSLEVAISSIGGHPVHVDTQELRLGREESIEDFGRALSRYVAAIVLRTSGHERLEYLAAAADVPVINSLSDFEHPCQCLADLMVIRERKGKLAGLTLAYLGDGNNVAHSLLIGGALAGMHVRMATPVGFEPIPQVVHHAEEIAVETGGSITITNDPVGAATGADVLYTDIWASLDQESETDERSIVFPPYRVDRAAVDRADADAIVLHCLPAHRGQEITDEVIDGPHSVVWDQAENRLHTQRALLLWLLDVDRD